VNATSALSPSNIDLSGSRPPRSISSLFELINAKIDIPSSTPNAPATRYTSPLKDTSSIQQLMPALLDKVTTTRGTEIPARINVNTAPRAVLSAVPRWQDSDIQSILDNRPDPSAGAPDPIFQTLTWLVTEANINPQTIQAIEKYITAQTQVYRVQVVGYFEGGGPTARIEAVIDTNQGFPRVVYRRDISELGKGFPVGPALSENNR
jgi:hypothetical protein